ncbi:hypothetical protein D9619_001206 [Psilocybe cf. subviscida]|uniref:Actin n=1 Tax=Psilocybe cf. subviscida TaxID=2480587 RepID=A0A8H5F2A7_9AGAR|nr:hypothetical protein D9619_001206 [Psilocybe cf. subviscida]
MEQIWSRAFRNELRVAPEEHPILLTESPSNPNANRERTMEVLFETFDAPAAYLANQAVLCLYGTKQTGIVVLCGEDITHIVPVYNGHAIKHAVTQFGIAGRELTIGLTKTLAGHGYPLHMYGTFTADPKIVKDIKETLSYVALDWRRELDETPWSNYMRKYQLPGTQILDLSHERCSVPEPLFRPQLLGLKCEGIHNAIHNAISKCDEELHQTLYKNIVLSGGSTMFPGMTARLTKEIRALAPPHLDVKIIAPAGRKHSVWIGGSILASLSTFQSMWISRAEYDERGPLIVHQRCLQ